MTAREVAGAEAGGQVTVARERVRKLLDHAAEQPLTVLCAPAGYGKTTALADWVGGRDFVWIALTAADNVAGRLAARLRGPALRECSTLVLDGYEALESEAAHDAVRAVLDRVAPSTRVVIASRVAPPLWHAAAVLDADALRFRHGEPGLLLNTALGLGLGRDQLARIAAEVEGWPAGLARIGAALLGDGSFDARLAHGRELIDAYLRAQVLDRCPPELRAFLRRTAILRDVNASLAAALLDDAEAGTQVTRALQAGLFEWAGGDSGRAAWPGDERKRRFAPTERGRWARLDPRLARVLRSELEASEPGRVADLHARASRWYERAGLMDDAIEHARAMRDEPRVAALTRRACADVLRGGRVADAVHAGRLALTRSQPEARRMRHALAANLGLALWLAGESGQAAALLEAWLTVPGGDRARVRVLAVLASIAAEEQQLEQALARSEAAVTLAERLGGATAVVAPVERLGGVAAALAPGGATADLALAFQSRAAALRAAGRVVLADDALGRASAITQRHPGALQHALTLVLQAELDLARDDGGERSRQATAAARAVLARHTDPGALAERLAAVSALHEPIERERCSDRSEA